MKKTLIISTAFSFLLSTLVMPYANFDDVGSLRAVYNNYLLEDNDTNVFEFIGEKILSAGFIYDNNEQKNLPLKQHPISSTVLVQIQTGVLFRQPFQESFIYTFPVIKTVQPLINLIASSQEFHQGIFHPPLLSA